MFLLAPISNADLKLQDVPSPSAGWDDICPFALTFNGYKHWGSFEKCAEIANARRRNTLNELRTCLFFEQRRCNHLGEQPDEELMNYIRSLLEAMRDKLKAGERS